MVSAGRLCPEPFPRLRILGDGFMAGGGNHPVVVCGALSSAGRFWPARLLSQRLVGGELRAGGGIGKVAGGSRGRVGRVPEEQPSAAGLGLAAPKDSSAGRLVVRSVGIGGCVGKSSFRLADCVFVPWARFVLPVMFGGGCRGRKMTLSFPANMSPSMGWLPVSGGQASQCLPGCALQRTMSLGLMSFGFRSEVCKALFGCGLV